MFRLLIVVKRDRFGVEKYPGHLLGDGISADTADMILR